MSEFRHRLTRHAQVRSQQRGLKKSDLQLLLRTASQVSPDAYLLTHVDAEREIALRKREIQILERLRGYKVVIDGASVLTCYPARRTNQQKAIRHGRQKCI